MSWLILEPMSLKVNIMNKLKAYMLDKKNWYNLDNYLEIISTMSFFLAYSFQGPHLCLFGSSIYPLSNISAVW